MFYFLQIKDENGFSVVDHVANDTSEAVYVEHAFEYKIPWPEWTKAHRLVEWVEQNRPDWTVTSRNVDYNWLSKALQDNKDKPWNFM